MYPDAPERYTKFWMEREQRQHHVEYLLSRSRRVLQLGSLCGIRNVVGIDIQSSQRPCGTHRRYFKSSAIPFEHQWFCFGKSIGPHLVRFLL